MAMISGIILGLAAKLVDVPEVTWKLPVLDDIGGRFGIWIFAATLLAVRSDTPAYAAVRVFGFFASMLLTYYLYTVLFLGFYPKSQMILWGSISLISPFCAFIIWFSNERNRAAAILGALPIAVIFAEWYVTGSENNLLFIAYLSMIICLLLFVPGTAKKRLSVLLYAAVMALLLIKTGLMDFICRELLNI
ncbi:hypothetical protein V3C10_18775 [[Clostridium] symbiosum]|uniref:hypothetical protein n=1 Tax=Clostridium symbiosum TaxID=1512 RepID=UPI001D063825|nr:hypothetical protein [[Clostridium] symbiosum]MCB6611121.1 hypothetical protein [[Clostridium] symbiosum]MCB6930237.1 hypothetical protein [[Clostridium] symbiosum]